MQTSNNTISGEQKLYQFEQESSAQHFLWSAAEEPLFGCAVPDGQNEPQQCDIDVNIESRQGAHIINSSASGMVLK